MTLPSRVSLRDTVPVSVSLIGFRFDSEGGDGGIAVAARPTSRMCEKRSIAFSTPLV